jgi:Flp pilus assembly protein TadG
MRLGSRHRRGGQAVEFALVLPPMVLLIAGIVDYGFYYSRSLTVISAARDGARAGATDASTSSSGTNPTPCQAAADAVQTAMRAGGFSGFSDTGTNLVITVSTDADASGVADTTTNAKMILVEIVQPYTPFWLPSGLAPNALRGRMIARLEDQGNATCSQ